MIKENEMTVVSLPKLGDFNYNSWKSDMKVLLIEKGCWEFIIGTAKPCPDDVSDRDKQFLPPEYDNLVQILYRLKDAEFTIAEVTKQLITESGRIELKVKDENDYQSAANDKLQGLRSLKIINRSTRIRRQCRDPTAVET
ncbi:hypothetical protein HNY73_005390 [Argiope bruennichi]|uniref:DUF4219 domain-containing protein n=1 Tax=Argiope bruennichi TaxID=94029 RepID=A0A8T0FLT3_ARGBR|nr:hypothetical protein HNY73_005390 [Argiope bruennichi]